jgi:hypothetical protein
MRAWVFDQLIGFVVGGVVGFILSAMLFFPVG